jgi:hypothetical protein
MIARPSGRPYARTVSSYWQNALVLAVTFGIVWHLSWHGSA